MIGNRPTINCRDFEHLCWVLNQFENGRPVEEVASREPDGSVVRFGDRKYALHIMSLLGLGISVDDLAAFQRATTGTS